MFSRAIKKAAFVGLGLSGRVKEVVDELVTKGEENQSSEARRVKAFFEAIENRCENRKEEISQRAADLCNRVVTKASLPTKDDFNRLEKELHELGSKFRHWEEHSENKKSTSTASPESPTSP